MKKFFLSFIFLLALLSARSQAGHLDPSFNGKGYNFVDFKKGNFYSEYVSQVLLTGNGYLVVFAINNYTSLARYHSGNGSLDDGFASKGFTEPIDIIEPKAALQCDGKIVIAGNSYDTATGHYNFVLARYKSNGTLDKDFGEGGKQTTDFFDDDDVATSVAIQGDGKIVLAGYAYNTGTGNYDFALARYKTDGSLDNSFDGDGKLTTDFLGNNDNAYAILIQSDGKIVVAGEAYNPGAGNYDFALARYNTDGSLDNSFDGDGKQTTDFAGADDYANALVIQGDGKIVAAGLANDPGSDADFALARYNTDGSPDNSFNGGGKQTTDFFGKYDYAAAVALQSDGKIVVAGLADSTTLNTDYDFALARYNTDGSPDNCFSGDGKQVTDFFGSIDYANSVVIQSDGKIVAAGLASDTTGNVDIALTRYKPNGDLDNSFDHDGKLTGYYPGVESFVDAIAVQKDGKILVAGYTYNSSDQNVDFALARYKANGDLDNSFDHDGRQITDFFGGDDGAFAIALQKDGKIVLAGTDYNPVTGHYDLALVRYKPDGSLDKSFDHDGKQATAFPGGDANAYGVAIQSNGKIVVVGQAYNPANDNNDFTLARYNTNGSLDNSFNGDGKQTTVFFTGDDFATSVAIQKDGKIVAAGQAFNPNSSNFDFALARYNTDGSPDNSFNADGKQTTDFFGGNDNATAVAIQSNGKIVAAGETYNPTTGVTDFALARYNTDGSPDNSFDADGKQIIDFFGNNSYASAIAIQNDGKILVAGSVAYTNHAEFAVARCKPDGLPDNSFDGDGKHTTNFTGTSSFATSLSIYNNKVYVGGYSYSFMERGVVAAYLLENAGKNAGIEVASEVPLATGQVLTQIFTVKAWPNPSANYFKLSLQSESNSAAIIMVTDVLGKVIEIKTNVAANSTLQLGYNYSPGIYNVEIIQGNNKAVVKLVKQ